MNAGAAAGPIPKCRARCSFCKQKCSGSNCPRSRTSADRAGVRGGRPGFLIRKLIPWIGATTSHLREMYLVRDQTGSERSEPAEVEVRKYPMPQLCHALTRIRPRCQYRAGTAQPRRRSTTMIGLHVLQGPLVAVPESNIRASVTEICCSADVLALLEYSTGGAEKISRGNLLSPH